MRDEEGGKWLVTTIKRKTKDYDGEMIWGPYIYNKKWSIPFIYMSSFLRFYKSLKQYWSTVDLMIHDTFENVLVTSSLSGPPPDEPNSNTLPLDTSFFIDTYS